MVQVARLSIGVGAGGSSGMQLAEYLYDGAKLANLELEWSPLEQLWASRRSLQSAADSRRRLVGGIAAPAAGASGRIDVGTVAGSR